MWNPKVDPRRDESQAVKTSLTNASHHFTRQPVGEMFESDALDRQDTQIQNKRREEVLIKANEKSCDLNNMKSHFSHQTKQRTSIVFNTTDHSIHANCCTTKSQFWRRHFYQHLKMSDKRTKPLHLNTTKMFSIILIVLCFLSELSSCQADKTGGNILTNLNNDRNSEPLRPECKKNVPECEPLPNGTTCFGVKLPYAYSTTQLSTDSINFEEVQKNLLLWKGLMNAPRCWEVVQPLLCGVYLPKCVPSSDNQTQSYITLVGKELCEVGHKHCKVVETSRGWPDFLQCDQPHFPPGCTNVMFKDVKFNLTGRCERPLVPTSNKLSWYEDVDGCGIQCQNPLFTDDEHESVHIAIAVSASICTILTLFAVLTFVVDWKNANRYPALILFFVNACFLVGSVGWLAQFFPGAREDIVCRSDKTLRKAEPQIGSGESASCVVVFVLVYYSLMAGLTWFVILAYAWHLTFKVLGTPRDVIEGKKGHFHLTAWSIPLVLTVVCLALKQIDGDSVSGICFVGNLHGAYRGGFVLAPVGIAIICGLFFLIKGLVTLCKLKRESPGVISDRASAKLRETIIRLGTFTGLAFTWVAITFVVHVYMYLNEPAWNKSFQDFVVCEANVTVAKTVSNNTLPCQLESRPSLVAMIMHILAFFGAGISMSSWVWNASTVDIWKRFIRRCLRLPDNKTVKLRKHKVIAQAYGNKRKKGKLGKSRHISFSYQSSHDDPLGMRLDFNSNTSQSDISGRWAKGLPRLMRRRHGMAYPHKTSKRQSDNRRFSDSDVQSIHSFTRRLSIESRRLSLESVMSDIELNKRRKKKKTRKQLSKNRVVPIFPDSETSQIDCGGGGIQMDTFVTEHITSRHIARRLRRHGNQRTTDLDAKDDVLVHDLDQEEGQGRRSGKNSPAKSKQTKVHPFSANMDEMDLPLAETTKKTVNDKSRKKAQPACIMVRPASETSMWTSDSHSVQHPSTRDRQGVETGYLNHSFRRGSNASSNASNPSAKGSSTGRPDSSGRRSNQSGHRDSGAQILQVNQLQHQYNMFTASSLLPQTQPPGTVSNTCTDLGSVTSLDMDMESSMARLQTRRDWGSILERYTPDIHRYTPELFLEIEDLEELENTDHWSENSEEEVTEQY